MTYGLRCWNASKNLTLDINENITRVRFQTEVAASVTASINLPDISGKSTIQLGLSLKGARTPHVVIRSGTVITWRARGSVHFPTGSTLVQVFLYD